MEPTVISIDPALKYQFVRPEPVPAMFAGMTQPKDPATPAEWFCARFPSLAERYGPPILESLLPGDPPEIGAAALNEDFFAAMLGGDPALGHHVIFNTDDQQFYFYDNRQALYLPASEAKLILLLSQYLVHCAADMPANVHLPGLLQELREEYSLRRVVRRAKALLAADESFFSENSSHKRPKGAETHRSVARSFVNGVLAPAEDAVLTITECFERFNDYCTRRQMEAVNRRLFRPLFKELVSERFHLNIRHDLMGPNNRQQHGWLGLRMTENL